MVGESVTGNCTQNGNPSSLNCTTLICSLEDCAVGSSGLQETMSAVERVFGIEILREEILKHVISNNSGTIFRKSVKNARFVQISWFETVTKILGKLEEPEPLIVLAVDGNGNAEDPTEKGDQRLDQLVERFGTCERPLESFLHVKLYFKLEFFRERNYPSFSNCLSRLGSELVELEVEYPKAGGTMPSCFAPFKLPQLRKLSFQFSDKKLVKETGEDEDFADNRNGLWLLQTILNASQNLQSFVIPCSKTPVGFKYLRLPVMMSVLTLRIRLTNKDLETLLILRNQLPNLTHFTLLLHEKPFADQLLFRILEQFRQTLQTLTLPGFISNGHPTPHTLLQFPCMEKLWKLEISSTNYELAPSNTLALQKYLPGVKIMTFDLQSEARLVKWIENSKFETVECVTVILVNELLLRTHERYYVSPNFETFAQLHQAFPNVSSMSITFNISDLTGLKSLFQNIVHLKDLRIGIFGNEAVLDNGSDLIDSALLGLPLWMVEGLKKDQGSNLNLESILKGCNEPSIRNFSELATLYLWTKPRKDSDVEEDVPKSLISDLLFQQSFMKMTKLRNLKFVGKFQPTLKMKEEWENQGRFSSYKNT